MWEGKVITKKVKDKGRGETAGASAVWVPRGAAHRRLTAPLSAGVFTTGLMTISTVYGLLM